MNYAISEMHDAFYVINADTGATIMGGPYKNEESAKRRIRDLKRKTAPVAATVPADASNDVPAPAVNHLGETPDEAYEASAAYAGAAYREMDARPNHPRGYHPKFRPMGGSRSN